MYADITYLGIFIK